MTIFLEEKLYYFTLAITIALLIAKIFGFLGTPKFCLLLS